MCKFCGSKYVELEKRVYQVEGVCKENKSEIKNIYSNLADTKKDINRINIKDMLKEVHYKTGKPVYTFNFIAEEFNISLYEVQKIAKEIGIKRQVRGKI